jgi:hypothetical protein
MKALRDSPVERGFQRSRVKREYRRSQRPVYRKNRRPVPQKTPAWPRPVQQKDRSLLLGLKVRAQHPLLNQGFQKSPRPLPQEHRAVRIIPAAKRVG